MILYTLSALAWVLIPLVLGPIAWTTFLCLALKYTAVKYFLIGYVIVIYLDRRTCERGGRRSDWFRRLKWWQYFRDYFPIKLIKTVELPPDKNYLLALFPHGIISSGGFATFATDSMKFEEIFPGLRSYYCILTMNFFMPFLREVPNLTGMISASEKSLNWVLSNPKKGNVAALVVGGAAEALYNKPGVYKIYLKSRKGFCRVALQNGSPLVPAFTFGETGVFEQFIPQEGSLIDTFQRWFKKLTGLAPVLGYGRLGLIPRKTPLTVVIGKPIDVPLTKNPSKTEIDGLHRRFVESINKLFNDGKHKYIDDPNAELIIC